MILVFIFHLLELDYGRVVACPLLYSTNTFLKHHINQRFLNDVHYVWCSESFDSTKLGAYAAGAIVAASSDPCSIYKRLAEEIRKGSPDRHSSKITEQKASLNSLAIKLRDAGKITPNEAEEIAYMVDTAEISYWRPLIYVIPRQPIAARLKLVPPNARASIGVEYIIEDLHRDEFDIIEVS